MTEEVEKRKCPKCGGRMYLWKGYGRDERPVWHCAGRSFLICHYKED